MVSPILYVYCLQGVVLSNPMMARITGSGTFIENLFCTIWPASVAVSRNDGVVRTEKVLLRRYSQTYTYSDVRVCRLFIFLCYLSIL